MPACRDDRRFTQGATTVIELRSDMLVELVNSMGDDTSVVRAAKVSTVAGAGRWRSAGPVADTLATAKLIGYLMRNRHGSPFEHTAFAFYVEAPIFVWREIMRHRIASYNEESARYRQLGPVFYVPDRERDLVQSGSSAHPLLTPGSDYQHAHVEHELARAAVAAYDAYERLLSNGIAREVARMVLPVSIYSSAYVTMNARALMNFLSLRTSNLDATYPSHPMREIEAVARQFETIFAERMPVTHTAFVENGRIAP